MTHLTHWIVALLASTVAVAASTRSRSEAQDSLANSKPTPNWIRNGPAPVDSFDVLGVKLGDTPDAVLQALQQVDPSLRHERGMGRVNGKFGVITLYYTEALPTRRVWQLWHDQPFRKDERPRTNDVAHALLKKYGNPNELLKASQTLTWKNDLSETCSQDGPGTTSDGRGCSVLTINLEGRELTEVARKRLTSFELRRQDQLAAQESARRKHAQDLEDAARRGVPQL